MTVVLQDTLTKAEHVLVANDHGEDVLAQRRTFQDLMGPELIAGVEQIMERSVIAFMSANHIQPDIGVETFLLAPREYEPPQVRSVDGKRPTA